MLLKMQPQSLLLEMLPTVHATLRSMLAATIEASSFRNRSALDSVEDCSFWKFVIDSFSVHFV